ncbi:4'-phosphopantetheinyl transferase family protein [Gorillibacterium sp. sgz500922]|uniref:4'-phosphopantetheinyl transferase family protein n=1 Tax=Gorillibacterium sp. sgz500922 TaxID=3446694 RepID=UPI003F67D887
MKPYNGELFVESDRASYKAGVCFCNYSYIERHCEVQSFLHAEELDYFHELRFEKRIKSYLIGRYAAKQAFVHQIGGDRLQQVAIKNGIFGQPVLASPHSSHLQVSITHCGDIGGAIAFPEACPMGIDIESISILSQSGFLSQMTNTEKGLVGKLQMENGRSVAEIVTLIWSAKESLSKVLKTGLTVPFEILEVSDIAYNGNDYVCYYKNFIQYRTLSTRKEDYVLSITCPKNLRIQNIEKVFDGFCTNAGQVLPGDSLDPTGTDL